jgi:hypothetical protein
MNMGDGYYAKSGIFPKLYGVTAQMNLLYIITAVGTSNVGFVYV